MRDVATQSRMLQRLTSNSLRMQLPDLTVDVVLALNMLRQCLVPVTCSFNECRIGLPYISFSHTYSIHILGAGTQQSVPLSCRCELQVWLITSGCDL
jgi:hypothetical protein